MSRLMKRRSNIWITAAARQLWAICGWRIGQGRTLFLNGTRLVKPSVWINLSRSTLAARSSATATAPMNRFAKHCALQGRPVLLAGCWAHTRRGFYEALDHAPKEAGWVMRQIAHLYDIERKLRPQRGGPALRDAYRASQSAPI